MSILSYKYKAHKFINYVFYVVVFIVGFLLGFASEKINYNKLISQVLIIDNVQAYELGILNGNIVDEKYIYDIFSTNPDFDISEYHYITCSFNPSGLIYFNCIALNEETYNNVNFNWRSSSSYYFKTYTNKTYDFISFDYDRNTSSFSTTHHNFVGSNDTSNLPNYSYSTTSVLYMNFSKDSFPDYAKARNLLDFSSFGKLEFNENLFKDNPDFKEVCVDENSTIAITRTDNPENLEYMTDYDYIWFPYGLNGLKSYNYHNADLINNDSEFSTKLDWSTDNVYEYDNYSTDFFKDKETINEIFNDDIKGENLKFKGYTDKNLYYGWTSALFNLWFDYRDGNNFNFFPIFEFENLTKLYINDFSGTIHGGGGTRLDGDEEIELSNQYCFYIKKEYSVTKVYKNEFNDISGNVPTQNGDFNFSTSQNKNNNNSGNFLSQPKNFINSMKDTINFINSLIYEFYISLPLLLRTFIITLLIILIIMLIMKIGGYS